jgi:hypothetical protein
MTVYVSLELWATANDRLWEPMLGVTADVRLCESRAEDDSLWQGVEDPFIGLQLMARGRRRYSSDDN